MLTRCFLKAPQWRSQATLRTRDAATAKSKVLTLVTYVEIPYSPFLHFPATDYAEAHYNLGLLYFELGNRDDAQEQYQILIGLNSELAGALLKKFAKLNP